MFSEALRGAGDAQRAVYEQVVRGVFEGLVGAVLAAKPRAGIDRARAAARVLWAAEHGAAMLSLDGSLASLGAESLERVAADLTRALRIEG
jgi:hypothetical protein